MSTSVQKRLSDFGTDPIHDFQNRCSIQKIIVEIPLNVSNDAYLYVKRRKRLNIHRIGMQPGRFIEELPRWAIKKYSKRGEAILDPFVGSGTTMVEARIFGQHSFGIDHNPLARLISKVKSTPLSLHEVKLEKSRLLRLINQNRFSVYEFPKFKNRDFWFDIHVSEALSILRHCIREVVNPDIRDFFWACFSEVVRKVSNVGDGQVLQARRKSFKQKEKVSKSDVIAKFRKRMDRNILLMKDFSKKADKEVTSSIIGTDARNLSPPEPIDMIITSPPYINAIDYIWANKLRLHWLQGTGWGVESDSHRLEISRQEIGTEYIPAKEYNKIGKIGIDEIDEKIEEIYYQKESCQQSRLRSRVTRKYFCDMREHLRNAYKILEYGCIYCIVMGDNTIRKVKVPTHKFLEMIAEDVGFEKIFQFQIILRNRSLNIPRNVDWADIIPYDRMLVLKKVG